MDFRREFCQRKKICYQFDNPINFIFYFNIANYIKSKIDYR